MKIGTNEVANDPGATMRKMQQVRRAALAPRDPSPQDRRVAAEASRKEAKARREIMEEKTTELQRRDTDSPSSQASTAGRGSPPIKSFPDEPLIDVVV